MYGKVSVAPWKAQRLPYVDNLVNLIVADDLGGLPIDEHYAGIEDLAMGGQVSLDPMPHVRREPVGTLIAPWLFYLFGGWMIGWASTPFDPRWAFTHPRRAAWMSLAGPAANALLVLAAAAGGHACLFRGGQADHRTSDTGAACLRASLFSVLRATGRYDDRSIIGA